MSAERLLSPLRRPVETTLHALGKAHTLFEQRENSSNPLIREAAGLAKFSVAFWAVVASIALNATGGPTPSRPRSDHVTQPDGTVLFVRKTA